MPNTEARSARTASAIAELKTAYIWSVNSAVEAGRSHLVQELADSYEREAREIMSESGGLGERPAAA